MNTILETAPHGGKLINLEVDDQRAALLKETALHFTDITLNERQMCDLELLATGVFSPLKGFMTRAEYESVLDRMRLQNDLLWSIPICLDVPESVAGNLQTGQSLSLRDPEGFLLAVMQVEDCWPADLQREARTIYGTEDDTHPGVAYLNRSAGTWYVGGKLEVISQPIHFDFKQLRQTPAEIRQTFARLGWKRIIGFQTRHPLHRPQFEITMDAMQRTGANLLLLPVAGMTKPGDFDHYTRVRCYRAVTSHYPPDSFVLNLLSLAMRLAGPRSALLDVIIAKNFGCTHFIVGHDHASPGCSKDGCPFYDPAAACRIAREYCRELDMEIISYEEMVYLPFEDEYRFRNQVPAGTQTISLSGSEIRDRFQLGRNVPDWATFPEVIAELRQGFPLPKDQGFTVFFTGLSGAGKSTIAKVLYSRFLEIGKRPVTLLDGDIVRLNLSSELKFTREHRDINVRRIGFVASEITKNRGIAICAPIAPYSATRQEIRTSIEASGGFIEVHVATPIQECEKRDRKGMYAKARAGKIQHFTGIDDPYEAPENPELRINTTSITPDEAAQQILLLLGRKGYL